MIQCSELALIAGSSFQWNSNMIQNALKSMEIKLNAQVSFMRTLLVN